MSAPPPGVNPAHLIRRDRMWTAMLVLLGIVNAVAGTIGTAVSGIDSAITSVAMAVVCFSAAAVRMFRAHS